MEKRVSEWRGMMDIRLHIAAILMVIAKRFSGVTVIYTDKPGLPVFPITDYHSDRPKNTLYTIPPGYDTTKLLNHE